jgi:hypothetical protein
MIAILTGAYFVAGIATAIITIDRWAWAGRSWRSIGRGCAIAALWPIMVLVAMSDLE